MRSLLNNPTTANSSSLSTTHYPLPTHFPGFIAGLFVARCLAEAWAVAVAPSPWLTLGLALFWGGSGLWWSRQRPLPHTFPLLLLTPYLVYPTIYPQLALFLFALTVLVLTRAYWQKIPLSANLAASLLALLFFALYVATLAPDVLPADNGEFQRVAAELGVAHPPGFTLYTLLGHLLIRLLPFVSPAYAMNLFAALTSALTLWGVYRLVYTLTQSHGGSATAVIALGSATSFWSQATTANVRSLTALCATLTLYGLVRFAQLRQAGDAHQAERALWGAIAALCLGITHHASLAFMGIVFGLFALWVDPGLLWPRRWGRPLLILLLSLLPLLYLPWRASVGAPGATPGLLTLHGFLNHVLARGFQGDFFYFGTAAELTQRFWVMGNVLTFQFSPWLLLVSGLGGGLLLWHNKPLGALFWGAFLVHTFITATYRAPQTVEYMLPAYVILAVFIGYALGKVDSGQWKVESGEKKLFSTFNFQLSTPLFLLLALSQTAHNYPSYALLHHDTTARDFAQTLLQAAPPNAVILAHWHWATPLWYLQRVEGQRPDVSVDFVYPTSEPYAQTWARRTAEARAAGHEVITTFYDPAVFTELPVPDPLGEAFLFRQRPLTTLPADFTPLDLRLGQDLHVLGYRLDDKATAVGQTASLVLAWQWHPPQPTTLFVHMVAFDGTITAQQDIPLTSLENGYHFTAFALTPHVGALPGDFALLVGAYTQGAEGITPLLNAQGEARTAVATLPLQAMTHPLFTQAPTYRPATDHSRTLIGLDWDTSQSPRLYLHWQTPAGFVTEVQDEGYILPEWIGGWGWVRQSAPVPMQNTFYVPFGQGIVWTGPLWQKEGFAVGESPLIWQYFHASWPLVRDTAVSIRLVGYEPDSQQWAWADLDEDFGTPAMGGIPTLKWIAGSTIYDPHRFTIPATATPGQTVGLTLGLYDAFTYRPIPPLDEQFTPATPWRRTTITP